MIESEKNKQTQNKQDKSRQRLSLYVHIPFCIKKCNYCDFLSFSAGAEEKEAYVQALLREIESYKGSEYTERDIISVFIGGGTPSVLTERQTERICEKIKSVFNNKIRCGADTGDDTKTVTDSDSKSSVGCEFSMEVNPGTVTASKCKIYRELGINRISIGLQSVQDEQLRLLGRIHNYEQFLESYELLRNAGIKNINIDFMSALPGQSVTSYCEGLERVLAMKPEHISAYSLIIEEGTPFYDIYNNKSDLLPDEEADRLMYSRTKEILKNFGYERYEISNYALPGYECVHNQVYWQRGEYLGLGLGSSSYVNHTRFHNTENIKEYIENCKLYDESYDKAYDSAHTDRAHNKAYGPICHDACKQMPGILRRDVQVLSKAEEMEEFMFLGLRRMKGVSLKEFQKQFGESMEQVYGSVIDKYTKSGFLMMYENADGKKVAKVPGQPDWYLALTDKGIDVSNHIFEEFLLS